MGGTAPQRRAPDRRVASKVGITRRDFLAALGIGVPSVVLLEGCSLTPAPDYPPPVHSQPDPAPFLHGVTAGDPHPDGSVIWTRVEPGATGEPIGVLWMVSEDPGFATVVAGGATTATAETDHCVTVPVSGLAADRWYWYRFEADGVASRSGRLRTAPTPGSSPERLRFAYASCQQLNDSWFVAHRAAAAEPGLDFFLHLGDYVYVDDEATRTLADYRAAYARWRREPLLRDLHAALPMVAMWDDGEFMNGVDRTMAPERFAAAKQAWFDWFPLVDPGARRTYRALSWGALADIPVLDVRTYRDPAIDSLDYVSGDGGEAYDPSRTTLGSAQYSWLTGLLSSSGAAWRLVGSGYNLSPWRLLNLEFLRNFRSDLPPNAGIYAPNEAWDDYMVERRDLLEFLVDHDIDNTLFATAHTHIYMASVLKPDPDSGSSPTAAFDFCTGSLTADPDPRKAFLGDLPTELAEAALHLAEEFVLSQNSPNMRHINLLDQGYTLVDVTPEEVVVEYRLIDTIDPEAQPYTGAKFRVASGSNAIEVLPAEHPRGSFA